LHFPIDGEANVCGGPAGGFLTFEVAARVLNGDSLKLKRGTFSATFFLACLAAMELEGVVLEEI
jgi:hypothetical protein